MGKAGAWRRRETGWPTRTAFHCAATAAGTKSGRIGGASSQAEADGDGIKITTRPRGWPALTGTGYAPGAFCSRKDELITPFPLFMGINKQNQQRNFQRINLQKSIKNKAAHDFINGWPNAIILSR
jgi:hypothetical protein